MMRLSHWFRQMLTHLLRQSLRWVEPAPPEDDTHTDTALLADVMPSAGERTPPAHWLAHIKPEPPEHWLALVDSLDDDTATADDAIDSMPPDAPAPPREFTRAGLRTIPARNGLRVRVGDTETAPDNAISPAEETDAESSSPTQPRTSSRPPLTVLSAAWNSQQGSSDVQAQESSRAEHAAVNVQQSTPHTPDAVQSYPASRETPPPVRLFAAERNNADALHSQTRRIDQMPNTDETASPAPRGTDYSDDVEIHAPQVRRSRLPLRFVRAGKSEGGELPRQVTREYATPETLKTSSPAPDAVPSLRLVSHQTTTPDAPPSTERRMQTPDALTSTERQIQTPPPSPTRTTQPSSATRVTYQQGEWARLIEEDETSAVHRVDAHNRAPADDAHHKRIDREQRGVTWNGWLS